MPPRTVCHHIDKFQSLTGFPGHSDPDMGHGHLPKSVFQSLTGFPGHSDAFLLMACHIAVSIPNGLPRPFRRWLRGGVRLLSHLVSIPNGLPRPFRRQQAKADCAISVLFQSLTGFPGHSDPCSPPISPAWLCVSIPNGLPRPFRRSHHQARTFYKNVFQSLTGFPGHSDRALRERAQAAAGVSIPNGLPRPFRRHPCPLGA